MKISLQPPAALYMGSYGGYLNFWLIILSNLLFPKICKWSQKIWNEVTNRVMCIGISLDLPLCTNLVLKNEVGWNFSL